MIDLKNVEKAISLILSNRHESNIKVTLCESSKKKQNEEVLKNGKNIKSGRQSYMRS